MKKIFTILIIFINIYGFSQNSDSILVNERTIDRPLTVHKGQIQINTGYAISIIANDYDENGKKTNLAELGTAAVLHEYDLNVHFGILEFWEVQTGIKYAKKALREENETFLTTTDFTDVSYLYDYKGFDNLYLGTRIRYPFNKKTFDIYVSSGLFLPVFNHVSKEPEHTYTEITDDFISRKIVYKYNYPISNGAKMLNFGGGIKLRNKNIALTAVYEGNYPISVSKNILWTHRLVNNTFQYTENEYESLASSTTLLAVNLEYQALPWFNVRLAYSNYSEKNGWSEESTFRLSIPETSLHLLSGSYEIKITGKFWLNQYVSVPISAKNLTASLTFLTGISYNSFFK